MNAQEIFDEIRALGGRLEANGNRLHVDVPAGVLGPEHREKLTAFKPELLTLIRGNGSGRELQDSMRRLEATNVLLAISDDGILRVVQTEVDAHDAVMDGMTVYTPKDAYMYVTLSERERRMLHDFKKRFGGAVQWKPNQ